MVSYTFMGGFFAVCWTDFIQATMMLIAVIAIPSIIMTGSGGFAATMDAVNAQNPYLLSGSSCRRVSKKRFRSIS